MDSPGEGQQRFWHLAKPSNQCSSATTAAKWGGMWVEDCQRQAPADECGDDCTNPTQTEKSIGGCLGWWESRGANWRVVEPIGMIWNVLGRKREWLCTHVCTHVHARMHTSVQVRGCKWVQMSGRIQWNPKEYESGVLGSCKKIGLWWFTLEWKVQSAKLDFQKL